MCSAHRRLPDVFSAINPVHKGRSRSAPCALVQVLHCSPRARQSTSKYNSNAVFDGMECGLGTGIGKPEPSQQCVGFGVRSDEHLQLDPGRRPGRLGHVSAHRTCCCCCCTTLAFLGCYSQRGYSVQGRKAVVVTVGDSQQCAQRNKAACQDAVQLQVVPMPGKGFTEGSHDSSAQFKDTKSVEQRRTPRQRPGAGWERRRTDPKCLGLGRAAGGARPEP